MIKVNALEREIAGLESEILRRGKDLPGLPRLLQIRGLSVLAAIILLAEIGDIAWFDSSKQHVAYAGLATSVRQSGGTDRRGKTTKQGRKRLRTVAIRAVLGMVSGKPTPLGLCQIPSLSACERRTPLSAPAPLDLVGSPDDLSCSRGAEASTAERRL
jgi:Transposase IS116/IS110/IS902 family